MRRSAFLPLAAVAAVDSSTIAALCCVLRSISQIVWPVSPSPVAWSRAPVTMLTMCTLISETLADRAEDTARLVHKVNAVLDM